MSKASTAKTVKKANKAKKTKAPKKRVYFKFESPSAADVRLAGTFNEWDPDSRPLKKNKAGVWSTWMMLEKGRYEYRYVVDGEWTNDPAAAHCPNEYGGANCVLTVS